MEQTAVEWLVDKFSTQGTLHSSDISQAKAREKEIIRSAYLDGTDNEYDTSEEYYNKTFKSE